jgi:putative nucleotidyltransferase with HDIG domain
MMMLGVPSLLDVIVDDSKVSLREHLRDTATLARSWAIYDRLSPMDVEVFETAAFLHDVGKRLVPEEILYFAGPLDDEKRSVVREHVRLGAAIIGECVSARIVRIVFQRHERMDGGGYPSGIAGHNIDPLARRLAIVDAYVAMMESRPYQAVRSKAEVRAEIVRCAGSQFDLALAVDFVKYVEEQL